MISFTGSARAGTAISKNAADSLKRVHLDLGGKGANIVFADADENAVERGARHCFNNTGQSCNAPRGCWSSAAATTRRSRPLAPWLSNGREGGVWGLEDFCEVKAVSGWASE